jgi:large subunit ribosomal protein L25
MTIEVTAFPRAQQGSSASRRLRVSGRVPGIVYGADKKAQTVELDHKELLRNLGLETFHASILEMKLGNEKFQALLRDYQMHPWKKQVVHVDFQRVDPNRKIHMRVPLHFLNAEIAPGVKTGGGVVQQAMTSIDIQCLPADLPAYIEVDLKDMELNDTLHVTELPLPKGVEAVAKLKLEDPAVVSVHVPKEIVIEEGAEAAEGGEKKEGAAAAGEKKEPAAAEKKEPAKKGKE